MDSGSVRLTPLHVAAFEGNIAAARVRLESGKVHIDFQDMYGNTTVHYAAARGHNEFIRFCTTEFNANVLIPNYANELVLERGSGLEVAHAGKLSVSLSRDDTCPMTIGTNTPLLVRLRKPER